MNYKNTPCRKLIEWLLIEHRKTTWKVNQKIPYKQFLPYSKKFIITWINDNLFGSTKLMLLEIVKNISCPETIESKYKKLHPGIWSILSDPSVRVQMELDSFFGYSINEMHNRLNDRIKPRNVDRRAIEQFIYFFWNLKDDDDVFRPANMLELIGSNRTISRAYAHINKYYNDKNGKYKYEIYLSEKNNLANIFFNKKETLQNLPKITPLRLWRSLVAYSFSPVNLFVFTSNDILKTNCFNQNFPSPVQSLNSPKMSKIFKGNF